MSVPARLCHRLPLASIRICAVSRFAGPINVEYHARTRGIATTSPPPPPVSVAAVAGMATATKMDVAVDNTGLLGVKQTDDTARTVTGVLQKDLETHHVFFNNKGFHNHIPHHVLALYGTGAPAALIQEAYEHNTTYQRPVQPLHQDVVENLVTHSSWDSLLGKEAHYPEFLAFFQREIDARGWQHVLSEHLLDRSSPRAEALLQRMFAGFLHPLIQLMYGVEWAQPAIVAQALAQAAVHENSLGEFLAEAETRADDAGKSATTTDDATWSVAGLYVAAHRNEALRGSIRSEDGNKMRDGVLARAGEEALELAARVHVAADQAVVDERTAEMFEGAIAMAASGALVEAAKRGKEERFDFFLMHHVNSAPIFVTINRQDWIPVETKARLLEWKIRLDVIQYVARGSTPFNVDGELDYTPQDDVVTTEAEDLLPKIHAVPDDGHVCKMARALLVARSLSEKYLDRDWVRVRGADVAWVRLHYLKLMHLLYDSTCRGAEVKWVRTGGVDSAWENVPDKK